ncbi:branched-chain amino acid ABC transporter permease [Abyssisolibacter fermentans]|uniref:branched-chain amino acid ABC transporter permease n=1 Tax=Abyssisolibacter fermentans TaxID=1766203 RepID=UPI00083072A8|nr:branched-chain amino acid ABC transporter permease [Abyssisolibacter fermentans]
MIVQQLINGLTIGSTYALVAIGYTMVFGILELVNFSHGSVYMTGAFLTLIFLTSFGANFFLAFVISIILTGLLGVMVDRCALKPLRKKNAPKVSSLISTIGVSIFLQNLVMMICGSETKNFPLIIDLGSFNIGEASISYLQIIIFSICILLLIALQILVNKTKVGKAMRATAQNMEAARLMGINVNTIITLTFFIGAALASVAGTMVGMYYQTVDYAMGFMVGLKAFAAAVLGGIGVLPGAMLGGLTIGIIETITAGYFNAGYRDAVAFAILIIVLIFKPSGLLGKQAPKKV